MQTKIGHLVYNVRPDNMQFYRDLFGLMGWNTLYDGPGGPDVPLLGLGASDGTSIWFTGKVNDADNHYDGAGLNHLAINTAARADVDATSEHLVQRGVQMLFDTPRDRHEWAGDAGSYYQIMFETPDRILIEVVYTGPRAQAASI